MFQDMMLGTGHKAQGTQLSAISFQCSTLRTGLRIRHPELNLGLRTQDSGLKIGGWQQCLI